MNEEKTIASLATPVGMGALAVIRMSGGDSMAVLARCTQTGATTRMKARRATLLDLLDEQGNSIDQVLATWFPSPASYTGDEMVEISCHGGMLVTRRVLERLFSCGAVPAEPGEFTKRAFLAGKMDLTQAEAVMDIISAGGDLALKAAREQLGGAIGNRVEGIRETLVGILAHIEAYIDFPDEDISPDTSTQLDEKITSIQKNIASLLDTADQGRFLREGIRTAIVGEPNVGKSSILNTLLGYERAIVSDVPGTTRDTVEETLHLGGMALRLIDTAGVRESSDTIEKAGIERTGKAIASADLIIEVVDSSLPKGTSMLVPEQEAFRILVLNKTDLPEHPDWTHSAAVRFSCVANRGREELEQAIKQAFSSKIHTGEGESLASINIRHRDALRRCADALEQARLSLNAGESPEFTSLELRESLTHLGEITGQTDTEEILGAIFSTFCLGK